MLKAKLLLIALLLLAVGSVFFVHHKDVVQAAAKAQIAAAAAAKIKAANSACSDNNLAQNIVVSISKRQLWACTITTVEYTSPVVTGMESLPADLTPVGTYHISSKQTDQILNGCDSTGCWNDPVSYWMPWLSNQYGVYGFHDAIWRAPSDFGNIDPNSANASHGCVELPLATAKWLYGWAQIGATVTIES